MTTRATNSLWSQKITDCAQGSEMDQRERGIINCRGFKINFLFYNILPSTPLYVNFAVIAPKRLTSGSPTPVEGANFFRSAGATRASDFTGAGETPFERHVRMINPDDYTILYHKRMTLAPSSASAGGGNSGGIPSFRAINKYLKLNRAITYANPESTSATDGMVSIAYWFGAVAGSDGVTPVAACTVHERVVMYFKEPKQ